MLSLCLYPSHYRPLYGPSVSCVDTSSHPRQQWLLLGEGVGRWLRTRSTALLHSQSILALFLRPVLQVTIQCPKLLTIRYVSRVRIHAIITKSASVLFLILTVTKFWRTYRAICGRTYDPRTVMTQMKHISPLLTAFVEDGCIFFAL